jgi:hypothetical protein
MTKSDTTQPFEYRMTIAPHFNERRQIPTTRITIETTKLFATFKYELSVQDEIRGKELRYTIRGIRMPKLSLPAPGGAQYVCEYDNLKGKHDIVVESLDGTVNSFCVNFSKQSIKILKSPKSPFIELVIV